MTLHLGEAQATIKRLEHEETESAVLSGKLESERDQLQATVTAQAKEIVRLTACITAQGAQMHSYHDALKQVLASGKEAI